MGEITLRNVSKSFGTTTVIPDIDLEIANGEFVVFVGPSGCGKSTLLRLIAGLEDVSGGTIAIDGRDVTREAPAKRGLAMVFQSYALYPHMSVRNNIAFPLKMAGEDKAVIDKKVNDAARVLNLTDYLDRRPGQLSGGQRQRVAIGRAIVRQPAAFLFDEPLSNLDAALRGTMRLEISELHQRLAKTMIYVTHDQVEAMTMADKIVVLNAGKVEQVGSPLDLYRFPRNLFVAGFIGSPRMNLVSGEPAARRGAAMMGARPEHIRISRENGEWPGTVGVAEHLGADTFLHVHTDAAGTVTVRADGEVALNHGDRVFLSPDPAKIHLFGADGLATPRSAPAMQGAAH
ncbi:MAG TPA: ABC transporter ATP-binding protein [Mesorhizobium sp.]|jgi:multiple sugar transport system ATP-binding protein|nr:ABC transporter ATP-binding protein [Mesorhizobium sp.]